MVHIRVRMTSSSEMQVTEMYRFPRLSLHMQCALLSCCTILLFTCEGISTTLSPLGMVSVCPGGQVVLTCETTSSSFLYWTVSFPHLALAPERIVPDQGNITSPRFNIGFTEFSITRISQNPLSTQLLIINVTTGINGSNMVCSVDGNENNAPMVTINVIEYTDDTLPDDQNSLNITLTNHFLRKSNLTIMLKWPQEPGAVYNVDLLPAIPAKFIMAMSHNFVTINLTISYDIQYTSTIVSSLCGITTTKVLNYVTCDYRPTQLHGTVIVTMTTRSRSDSPPTEGQFITYTCPPRYILTGPNESVCMGNGEWEPDPGDVECTADCGVPFMNRNVKLNYSSTVDGSVLMLTCENDINTTDERVLNVTCHSNGNWIPDPAEFTCSSFTTALPDIQNGSSAGAEVILVLGSTLGILIFGAIAIIIIILSLIKIGILHPKKINRLPDIQLENNNQPCVENSTEQSDQQDTLVYADIGPSSFKKKANRHDVTLSPEDTDDRVEYALLNHSLQKPVVETKQDSVADASLNLDTLLIQLQGAVTSRWYQLGEALEVDKDVLDKCTNYPPEESIIEILDQWLRKFPGHPTWRDVARALRKINLQQLADNIENVYKTGKLPIHGDNSQQVFTITAVELPQPETEKTRENCFNKHHNQDESADSAPPLPPKPLAGSDMSKRVIAPHRPLKYAVK